MAIRIDDSFEVPAEPEQVWDYLVDPHQVVNCLPGAELLEADDSGSFTGRIRVKVGPVTASYRGRARFDEVDAAARRVRMTGRAQETGGGGAASMTMVSIVTELPGGGARVEVQSELEVAGRMVQFGRGMIEEVSRQLFREFAECVRSRLAAQSAASSGAADISAGEPAPAAAAARPTGESAAGDFAAPAAASDAGTPRCSNGTVQQPAPPPLRALPLLWRAFRSQVSRFFSRREGGGA